MRTWRTGYRRAGAWVAVVTWAAFGPWGCHNAHRANPMDPALTPPVQQVEATASDTEGVIRVSWSPYAGRQPFAAYLVLRKGRGLEQVDSVGVIRAVAVTSLADSTAFPEIDYLYRVDVQTAAGFVRAGDWVPAPRLRAPGITLRQPRADSRTGRVILTWSRYRGAAFSGYRVLRREFLGASSVLAVRTAETDTVYTDTTARPQTDYTYRVAALLADGRQVDSSPKDMAYDLPPITLTDLSMDSGSATAHLVWTPYQGPRFAAYQIRRTDPSGGIRLFRLDGDVSRTTYTDSLLEGNTLYTYEVDVLTTWGQDVGTSSQARSGRFYGLVDEIDLPADPYHENTLNSVDIQVDSTGRLWVAATLAWNTTAHSMIKGVQIWNADEWGYTTIPRQTAPDMRSPVRLAVGRERVVMGATDEGGALTVMAVLRNHPSAQLWTRQVVSTGAVPVSIRIAGDEVVVLDDAGVLYGLAAEDGALKWTARGLALTVADAVPLQDAAWVPGYGPAGTDAWILLAPLRPAHRFIGVSQVSRTIFGRIPPLDAGVGTDGGQIVSPVAVAYDPERGRWYVLEEQGTIKVFKAGEEGQGARYVTRWGEFGSGAGQFRVSPSTAVALDVGPDGRVYVADNALGVGRVQIFAP